MEYFTFSNVFFTATGAIVFWAGKGEKSQLRALGLSSLVNLLPWNRGLKLFLQFIIFVGLGCIVGIAVAQPSNARQALTAGFGWTSLLTSLSKGKAQEIAK